MFDVGFSELIVIGIVALVVIGPEKLPKVARTLGLLLGRAQRYVNDVKADINREMQLDELKKLQSEVTDSARAIETSVRKELDSARVAVETPVQEASSGLNESVHALAPAPSASPVAAQMPAAVARHFQEPAPVSSLAATPEAASPPKA